MAIGKLKTDRQPAHDALVTEAAKPPRKAPRSTGTPKRINFEVDSATHAALKSRAAAEGATISDVLRKAVNEYLSK